MARADTVTWLSLDEFAKIIGLNPLHFNGFSSQFFTDNTCGEVFFQHDWQNADRVGREAIALAIRQAEMEMTQEAGYNLMPDWTAAERLDYPHPGMPGVMGYGLNSSGFLKSVEAKKGWIISGGIKTKTLIQAGAAIVRSDADGDGYAETATVTVPVTFTDINQVHVYYSTKSGSDAWEIRPITVAISVGFATITFKSWQVPDFSELEDLNPSPLDGDNVASYETTVDVYRVWNDPSTQAQLMWEGDEDLNCCGSCVACQYGTQAACFHTRDERLGIVVPAPGAWDAASETFTGQAFSACREPDQVRLWYYSGYVDDSLARPYAEMSNYWKTAVAFFAASKFERPVCGCSNVNQFIERWRRDAAAVTKEEGGFNMTAEMAGNRLGTSLGAIYAWRRIHQNGMRVTK